MDSSNSTDDRKYLNSQTSSEPSRYGQPASGIPVSSVNQNFPFQTQPGTEGPWSTGLFDCFSNLPNCCITCWCPCITFGQIAEIVDEGTTSWGASGAIYTLLGFFTGCACLYSCLYRSKMRKQYMLNESPCGDCLVHCCCEHCALCQEYRELQNRGFDMSSGWKGNVERQNYGVAMAPVVEGGMTK